MEVQRGYLGWQLTDMSMNHVYSFALVLTLRTDDLSPVHTLGGHRLGVLNIRANSNGSGMFLSLYWLG